MQLNILVRCLNKCLLSLTVHLSNNVRRRRRSKRETFCTMLIVLSPPQKRNGTIFLFLSFQESHGIVKLKIHINKTKSASGLVYMLMCGTYIQVLESQKGRTWGRDCFKDMMSREKKHKLPQSLYKLSKIDSESFPRLKCVGAGKQL